VIVLEAQRLGRRSNMDICVDILKAAEGGANKTRIVYQANLNFKIVKNYLKKLIEKDLLESADKFFITTQKGEEFIEQYKDLTLKI
jgi:predicted transcriptional regulator